MLFNPIRLLSALLCWTCICTGDAVATADSLSAVCEYSADCNEQHQQCIDNSSVAYLLTSQKSKRCMCDPRWAHKGLYCDNLRWNSWAMMVVLTSVSIISVSVLASTAKKLSKEPSEGCSGLTALVSLLRRTKGEDTGSATIRTVLLSATFDVMSYGWMALTATGVVSDSTSAVWEARIIFPISGGFMVLPTATVVSVWMDLAISSASRIKAMARLRRTKVVLRVGTMLYIVVLSLLCMSEHSEYAEVAQLGAIGFCLNACGSGAAKLCNKLRAAGGVSVDIAETVFNVSRSMGICLYAMFCGTVLQLSSRTRKSDPANLALAGVMVYTFAKCFLNKAIFQYLVRSARAKKARLQAASSPQSKIASSPISGRSSFRRRAAGQGRTKICIGDPLVDQDRHVDPNTGASAIVDIKRSTQDCSKVAAETGVEEKVTSHGVPDIQLQDAKASNSADASAKMAAPVES